MPASRSQSPRKNPSSKRTQTIGVRLTKPELAALDAYIASQAQEPGVTRAGMIANITVGELITAGVLAEGYDETTS